MDEAYFQRQIPAPEQRLTAEPVIRVVLVESRQMLREALTALLRHERDLVVVAEAHNAHSCYDIVDRNDVDVVLIDAHLPGIDGIAATRELVRRAPRCKVIVVSWAGDEHIAAQAIAAGARGYVAKDDSAEELITSLRQVAQGERHLSRQLRAHLVGGELDTNGGQPIDSLSPRQRDVFAMLVRGHGNGSIAAELCISVRTVETHRAAIMRKLDLHSLADLVRFAAVHGVSVGNAGA